MKPITTTHQGATGWRSVTDTWTAEKIREAFAGDENGLVLPLLAQVEALEAENARLRQELAASRLAAVRAVEADARRLEEIRKLVWEAKP